VISKKDPITNLPTIEHMFFEGLLVKSALVADKNGKLVEVFRTAGGNRTQYEGATRRVLDYLANDATFAKLASPEVLQKLGLAKAARRGRPSKAAQRT